MTTGVDLWYELISMFYKLQNLLTRWATGPTRREQIIRTYLGERPGMTAERGAQSFVQISIEHRGSFQAGIRVRG